jgi:hypothetical protein
MLRDAAEAFRQPIMLLHGDSHRFKVDRPLVDRHGAVHPHVTRVICFGWPFAASWVRIGYDASLPRRFSVTVREPRRPAGP